jgi:uncharacterized protein (TIGR03118 family)
MTKCPLAHGRLEWPSYSNAWSARSKSRADTLCESRICAEIADPPQASAYAAVATTVYLREAMNMQQHDINPGHLNDGGWAKIDVKSVLHDDAMRFRRHGGPDGGRQDQHGRGADSGRAFVQTNLISDGFVPAANTDENLINPWGVSSSPTGPFWVSDNGAGVATIYDGNGKPITIAGHTVITIAAPPGSTDPAAPTGQVFNSAGSGFEISEGGVSAPSVFLFATEDGTISGWAPSVDAGNSVIAVDNSGDGAVYKGLTMLQTASQTLLYAADFHGGKVDVFDHNFTLVDSFTDPSLPKGYAPFNVQNLGGHLFVSFALQDAAAHDDVAGPGHGFVDEFDPNGNLVQRIASHGPLNSPWGLDIAPANFGRFGGDLLVGNFGDGTIDAFDLKNDHFAGKLLGADGKPLVIGDLWALTNGNGGTAGDPNKVYFTAGIQDEAHGLFGSLSPADQHSSMSMHGASHAT